VGVGICCYLLATLFACVCCCVFWVLGLLFMCYNSVVVILSFSLLYICFGVFNIYCCAAYVC